MKSFDVVYGKKDAVLFADDHAFYIAELHHKLSKDQLEELRRGDCTVERMQEMGLSGTTIPRGEIRGIAAEGYDRADELIFHLNKKKKIAVLFSRHYDKEEADAFFRGIPRFQKARGRHTGVGRRHRDWHLREQDPAVRKRLEPVGLGLKWGSVLTFVATLIWPRCQGFWMLLSLLWMAAALVLLFFFEPYVTLLDDKEFREAGYSAKVIRLSFLPWMPFGFFVLRAFSAYSFFNQGTILVWGITLGLVIALVLWLFLREVHTHGMLAFAVAFVCCFFCIGILMHGNHYLAREEFVTEQACVVDKNSHSGRRGSRDYDLIVELPDGQRLNLDVGRATYNAYEPGDPLQVRTRTGALGLEYAMLGKQE